MIYILGWQRIIDLFLAISLHVRARQLDRVDRQLNENWFRKILSGVRPQQEEFFIPQTGTGLLGLSYLFSQSGREVVKFLGIYLPGSDANTYSPGQQEHPRKSSIHRFYQLNICRIPVLIMPLLLWRYWKAVFRSTSGT